MFEQTEEQVGGEDQIFGDLPMVVFLRGDEEHFSDFSMNADEVMALLGIRRSRLNQISGKELRVGRARVNGYVRPVFRKQDVEEYLKWIRPTATHKKSSELLNEARNKLEEQGDKLSTDLKTRFEGTVEQLMSFVQGQVFDQKKASFEAFARMQKLVHMGMKSLNQKMSFLQAETLSRWEDATKYGDELSTIKAELSRVHAANIQLTDSVLYMEQMLKELIKSKEEEALERLGTLTQGPIARSQRGNQRLRARQILRMKNEPQPSQKRNRRGEPKRRK